MKKFRATHVIQHDEERIDVHESDGALYTREEWNAGTRADWEFEDGVLTFQGGQLVGETTITPVPR